MKKATQNLPFESINISNILLELSRDFLYNVEHITGEKVLIDGIGNDQLRYCS